MINTIILLITIAVVAYLFYRQHTTNKQLHNEITTNSEAVQELESFTHHDESEIKNWIEDENRDMQYDIDDHGNSISNLQDDTVNQDEIDELKEWITKGEDKIIVMVEEITKQLDELLLDEEPEEKEIIEQTIIDEVLSVTVRMKRFKKDKDGEFCLKEQNEIDIPLNGDMQEDVTASLKHHSNNSGEFPPFLKNIYTGDKDEMGNK